MNKENKKILIIYGIIFPIVAITGWYSIVMLQFYWVMIIPLALYGFFAKNVT